MSTNAFFYPLDLLLNFIWIYNIYVRADGSNFGLSKTQANLSPSPREHQHVSALSQGYWLSHSQESSSYFLGYNS